MDTTQNPDPGAQAEPETLLCAPCRRGEHHTGAEDEACECLCGGEGAGSVAAQGSDGAEGPAEPNPPSESPTEPQGATSVNLSPVQAEPRRELAPGAPRCTAKRSNGVDNCRNPAMTGQKVCRLHGGRSPQALAAARRRILAALDPAAEALVEIALDPGRKDADRLRALDSLMDRGGLARQSETRVDVSQARQSIEERLAALDAERESAAESPGEGPPSVDPPAEHESLPAGPGGPSTTTTEPGSERGDPGGAGADPTGPE